MDDLKPTGNLNQGMISQSTGVPVSPSLGDQTIPKPTPPEQAPVAPVTSQSEKPPESPPQITTTPTTTTAIPEEKAKFKERFPKAPRKKIVAGIATLLFIVLGGISIGTAWKLKQTEKVTPEEAEAWVGNHCSGDCVIKVGPGKYGFVAAGHGMATVTKATISVNLPAGTEGYEAYAFWSGETKEGDLTYNDTSIKVNGHDVEAIKVFSAKNSYAGTSQIANLGKIQNSAVRGKTGKIDLNVSGLDNLNSDNSGGSGHGIGIVVIYTGENVGQNKIILRLWGEWLYLACAPHDNRTECEGPRSNTMTMNLSNLDLTREGESKFAFFFGEGEKWKGECINVEGKPKPNHLYYKTTGDWTKLEAQTGTANKWPACPLPDASQPGYWWTTRVSGENLDPIEVKGESIQFVADSAWVSNETKSDVGESYTFVGVVAQYPITEPTPTPTPTPLPGCWETCTPGTCPTGLECQDQDGLRCVNPACPSEENCECPTLACLALTATTTELIEGDEVDFTCKGSSGVDNPVDHVEFRVQIDGGSWSSLGTAPGTKTDGEYEGTISYTVPQTGSYRVECRVCTSTDESQCTEWGQAE